MFKRSCCSKELLSFLLAVCTVFSICGHLLPVYAVDELTAEEITAESAVISEELVLDAADVPELIDFETAKEKGHVMRMRDKETDDHTVIFLNEDNTETMYIFAEPIKYTDGNGETKDKSRALALENGKYVMAENDIQVGFPAGLSDGITVSKGDISISMIPAPAAANSSSGQISANATAALVDNRVTYNDVFGAADLQYTPLYSGFKEDIILDSYAGVSEFEFIMYTDGLLPMKNANGSVSFIDPTTEEAVAEMMQVVCYDAEQDFAAGDVSITQIKKNQIYGITVIANLEFLTDEDTLYPVSVDPTISFTGTTAIEDAVIYEGTPNANFASYHYNSVGYVSDTYKEGQLFVKFPTLSSNSVFSNLEPDNIASAALSLYTSSRGTGVVDVYRYDFGAWAESTITWNNITYPIAPVYQSTLTLPTGALAEAEFDITLSVRQWMGLSAMASPDRGVILINSDPGNSSVRRSFLSTEYANANNQSVMPCLTIEYDMPYQVILDDNDSDSNNIVEVRVNTTATFNAYVLYNGRKLYNVLTFELLDDTVATLPSASSASVRGIKYGTTAIRARFTDHPVYKADIIVSVWSEEISFRSGVTYKIDNDSYALTNLNRSFNIDARIKRNGEYLPYDQDITYTVEAYSLMCGTIELKDHPNVFDFGVSVNSNGVVSYTIPDINNMTSGLAAHPCGRIKVSAKSSNSYVEVFIEVVCGTPIDPPNGTAQVELCDGRHIRIDYPITEGADQYLPIGAIREFEEVIDTYSESKRFEYINTSFEPGDDGWFKYDYINAPSNHIGGSGYNRRFLELIATSKIACILTHGREGASELSVSSKSSYYVTPEDILSLHDGYFSYCDLIIVLSCDGATGVDNIMDAFYERGAKCVIAFSASESVPLLDQFETSFFETLGYGNKTINDAFNAGKDAMSDHQENACIIGNSDTILFS